MLSDATKHRLSETSLALQDIQTDGLVGLIGLNRVLLALAFGLTSFGKPENVLQGKV